MPFSARFTSGQFTNCLPKFLLLVCFITIAAPAYADEFPLRIGTNPRRTALVEVVERVKGAVVNIHSERTVSDNREKYLNLTPTQHRVNGMGTGVVLDSRGYIITNYHVVDDVQTLRVRLQDGTALMAKVLSRDPEADLAMLKVDHNRPLPTIPLGTASDLMLGEPVIAIGNAFGYEHTVTRGIVSALKRDVTLNKEVSYKSLIQTDASINPGNSGGPLLNIHGELIGINVAIRAGAQGIAFAIPVDNMLRTATEMLSIKRRTGSSHGIALKDEIDSSDNPIKRTAIVERCEVDSPATKAGIQPGDVLEKVGDTNIRCALDLERAMLDKSGGDKVQVVIRRSGAEVKAELALKTADRPVVAQSDAVWKKFGVKAVSVGVDAVAKVNPQLHGGLLITEVNADTLAARAGFQRGDILIGLHQWETVNLDNVTFVISHPDLPTFAPVRWYRIRNGQLQRGFLPTD
jgi:serine protease Do